MFHIKETGMQLVQQPLINRVKKWLTKIMVAMQKVVSPSSKTGYPELKGYTTHQEVVNASQATHGVDVGQVFS